jgi:thiamine-phosphate pyrophosphorylase
LVVGRLHVITDTRAGRNPLAVVTAALEAGAPVVQVRGKGLSDRLFYEFAARVLDRCHRHSAICVMNDRVHVALALGAHGVHVGEKDLPIAAARRLLDLDTGRRMVLGGTARTADAARFHATAGADYVGVGPCYETTTKVGLPTPGGAARVAAVAAVVDIPIIAIAGVTASRVGELVEAGAWGVAVVSEVSDAPDPHRAVEGLLLALERAGMPAR